MPFELRCPNCNDLIDTAHEPTECFRCGHPLFKPVTAKSRARHPFKETPLLNKPTDKATEMFESVGAVEEARSYKGVWAIILTALAIVIGKLIGQAIAGK